MLNNCVGSHLERSLSVAGMVLVLIAVVRLAAYATFPAVPSLFIYFVILKNPATRMQDSLKRTLAIDSVRLQIPRLDLDTAVLEGDSDTTLAFAAGHLLETAPIGSNGNAVIAGHRDTVFRALRNIQTGDRIGIVTPDENYVYRVVATRVVNPSDLTVLAPSRNPILTIITCYPFSFIGSAPKRFIVVAERVTPA